jgi:transcriptional regulator with PAS, ATPase and Fis domain
MPKQKLPAFMQSMLDVYQQPFVLVDRKFTIVGSNKAYADQYGLTPDDIVGTKCHKVSHNSDRPCAENGEDCPHVRMFRSGKVEEALHIHSMPDGSRSCVEIKAHPICGDDGEILYMGEHLRPIESDEMLGKVDLVGSSEAFLNAIREVATPAPSDIPILIYGESGVGKEKFASYIHKRSLRADAPFITLDCCGLSETLFESELFGHEAGSFTGAHRRKRGLFELADGGTLFLDEVGEISLVLQAKLLRVIETGEFRRVGGNQTLKVDVRIVSATNRDLQNMVEEQTFRSDLYYRLAGHTVTLPPLRERRDDIPQLICFFLQKIGRKSSPSPEAMRLLKQYRYPGNIRELRYIVELASLKALDGHIYPEHLPDTIRTHRIDKDDVGVAGPEANTGNAAADSPATLRRSNDHLILGLDARKVLQKLEECRGNRRAAARELGIGERKLYRVLKRCEEGGLAVPPPYQ